MSVGLAVCFSLDESTLLGKLRRCTGIEVCTVGESIWLRATSATEELAEQVKVLPGIHFMLMPDGELVEFGKRVPRGRLPQKQWLSLSQWMNVELGTPVPGGYTDKKVELRLARSSEVVEPNVLLTSLESWESYALKAPQIRLERLTFAVGEEGQVIIRGTPLPPCPGVRYVEQSNIAVEAGWKWLPAVSVAVLCEVLNRAEQDLALFHADHTWDLIPADTFVSASRSAVRLSMARFSHG